MSPLANSYVAPDRLTRWSRSTRCARYVCAGCLLVQLEEFETPEGIFSDYAYFSSYSTSWLEHAEPTSSRWSSGFGLDQGSQVVELASNDGYLLQYFHERGVPVLGIEPAANVAESRVEQGIPTRVEFFGARPRPGAGRRARPADLLLGNNVLAHVPDLNDFVGGHEDPAQARRRGHDGVPAPAEPDEQNQFDTIYHEHFSYFSLPHRRAGVRAARADAVRRRGAPHPRRLAAHLRRPRRRRGQAGHRAHDRAAPARDARRLRGPRDLRGVRPAGRAPTSATCSRS